MNKGKLWDFITLYFKTIEKGKPDNIQISNVDIIGSLRYVIYKSCVETLSILGMDPNGFIDSYDEINKSWEERSCIFNTGNYSKCVSIINPEFKTDSTTLKAPRIILSSVFCINTDIRMLIYQNNPVNTIAFTVRNNIDKTIEFTKEFDMSDNLRNVIIKYFTDLIGYITISAELSILDIFRARDNGSKKSFDSVMKDIYDIRSNGSKFLSYLYKYISCINDESSVVYDKRYGIYNSKYKDVINENCEFFMNTYIDPEFHCNSDDIDAITKVAENLCDCIDLRIAKTASIIRYSGIPFEYVTSRSGFDGDFYFHKALICLLNKYGIRIHNMPTNNIKLPVGITTNFNMPHVFLCKKGYPNEMIDPMTLTDKEEKSSFVRLYAYIDNICEMINNYKCDNNNSDTNQNNDSNNNTKMVYVDTGIPINPNGPFPIPPVVDNKNPMYSQMPNGINMIYPLSMMMGNGTTPNGLQFHNIESWNIEDIKVNKDGFSYVDFIETVSDAIIETKFSYELESIANIKELEARILTFKLMNYLKEISLDKFLRSNYEFNDINDDECGFDLTISSNGKIVEVFAITINDHDSRILRITNFITGSIVTEKKFVSSHYIKKHDLCLNLFLNGRCCNIDISPLLEEYKNINNMTKNISYDMIINSNYMRYELSNICLSIMHNLFFNLSNNIGYRNEGHNIPYKINDYSTIETLHEYNYHECLNSFENLADKGFLTPTSVDTLISMLNYFIAKFHDLYESDLDSINEGDYIKIDMIIYLPNGLVITGYNDGSNKLIELSYDKDKMKNIFTGNKNGSSFNIYMYDSLKSDEDNLLRLLYIESVSNISSLELSKNILSILKYLQYMFDHKNSAEDELEDF